MQIRCCSCYLHASLHPSGFMHPLHNAHLLCTAKASSKPLRSTACPIALGATQHQLSSAALFLKQPQREP